MRIFIYKAVTNPAFICQTVDDPILEAFNLSYELRNAANFDREFYYEYRSLSEVFLHLDLHWINQNHLNVLSRLQAVSQFATDLIGCARTVEEVEEILKQSTGFALSSKFLYPRLLFALHNKQRSFVAHPNIQQVIKKMNLLL